MLSFCLPINFWIKKSKTWLKLILWKSTKETVISFYWGKWGSYETVCLLWLLLLNRSIHITYRFYSTHTLEQHFPKFLVRVLPSAFSPDTPTRKKKTKHSLFINFYFLRLLKCFKFRFFLNFLIHTVKTKTVKIWNVLSCLFISKIKHHDITIRLIMSHWWTTVEESQC